MKIEGLGELWEGRLERDPMSEVFYLRFRDELGGLRGVDLQKMLEAYVGQDIRVVVSVVEAVRQASEKLGLNTVGVEGVTLEDLKNTPEPGDA